MTRTHPRSLIILQYPIEYQLILPSKYNTCQAELLLETKANTLCPKDHSTNLRGFKLSSNLCNFQCTRTYMYPQRGGSNLKWQFTLVSRHLWIREQNTIHHSQQFITQFQYCRETWNVITEGENHCIAFTDEHPAYPYSATDAARCRDGDVSRVSLKYGAAECSPGLLSMEWYPSIIVPGCRRMFTLVGEHGMVPLLVPGVFPPVGFSMQVHVFFRDTWRHPYITSCFVENVFASLVLLSMDSRIAPCEPFYTHSTRFVL